MNSHQVHVSVGDGEGEGGRGDSGCVGPDVGSPELDGSAGAPVSSGPVGDGESEVSAEADADASGEAEPDGPSPDPVLWESVAGTTVGLPSTGAGSSGPALPESSGTGSVAAVVDSLT